MASGIDSWRCTLTMVSRVYENCWTSLGRLCVEFLDLPRDDSDPAFLLGCLPTRMNKFFDTYCKNVYSEA